MEKGAVVTGMGVVSPAGIGKDENWESLLQGKSGIDRFSRLNPSHIPVSVGAEVKNFDPKKFIKDRKAIRLSFLNVHLALALLGILALYDAISVYKTKHMIDLGHTVLKTHLPMLIIVPKKRGYSFRQETAFSGEKNAIFMGLGDFIIPGILAASTFQFQQNVFAAITIIIGATLGLLCLMILAETGKPHAGLPWLNGGAIGGYLIFYFLSGELLGAI